MLNHRAFLGIPRASSNVKAWERKKDRNSNRKIWTPGYSLNFLFFFFFSFWQKWGLSHVMYTRCRVNNYPCDVRTAHGTDMNVAFVWFFFSTVNSMESKRCLFGTIPNMPDVSHTATWWKKKRACRWNTPSIADIGKVTGLQLELALTHVTTKLLQILCQEPLGGG